MSERPSPVAPALATAVVALLGAAGAYALAGGVPFAAARQAASADTVQIVADIVLIEAECHQFTVDYHKLFAFAEREGIDPIALMPLGERRASFDQAYRKRQRGFGHDRLCGDLAAQRDVDVPGVFIAR